MKKYLSFLFIISFTGFLFGQATTVTFNYTGAAQSWIVPPCVTSIQVDVRGGEGGGPQGGNGAKVTATLAVVPGDILQIKVGGSGAMSGTGYNGGGTGWAGQASSYGGGGASDIRVVPYALANRIIVAAGGGGHSGGTGYTVGGGGGGCATGINGTGSLFTGTGGTGGTQVAGGIGGPFYPGGQLGQNGSLGQGGNGGFWGTASGGGGGGGFYGGGGGGSDGCCTGANGGGGGGGGSSLTPAGGVCTQNNNNGAGIVTITYTPGLAPVTAGNAGPYCEGATINLTGSAGGTAYDWTGPNGYVSSGSQNPSIPASTVAMAGVYTVVVTGTPGCTGSATTTVVVNPMPVPVATNTGPYCTGATIQLNSPTGSATDDWAGPGYITNNVQNPTIMSSNAAMTGVYTVTVTNAFACSATATTAVTVFALPIPVANNTGPYCEGDVVDITSGGGVDYDWTGPGGFVLNNTQNTTIPAAVMSMNGTYTVTVTDVNNCSATATTDMVVNLLPIPTASNTGPYCAGYTISLSSSGGVGYAWSGPGGYASATQNPNIAASNPAQTGTYTVIVSSAAGCTATSSTNVVVTALPVPIATNTGPYCQGDKVDLTATGGVTYAWVGPLLFSTTAQNPSINNSVPDNTGTYTVTVTDIANCSSSTTTVVTVHATPSAVPLYNPSEPSTLNPDVNFFDESYANITSWSWDIDGMVYNTPTFTHTFLEGGTFTGVLTVINQWGCVDTTSFSVFIRPEISIYIPNSFTPNGDEMNEVFYVYGANWARMELIIFDRWGAEVFYSTDPTKGWDGSMNNTGETLMVGTYAYKVYIIDYYGKEHNLMGHINLLR